jgi:hypothetical protein
MSQHPHEPDELEPDPSVPPRPEEAVADAARQEPARGRAAAAETADRPAAETAERPVDEPVAGGDAEGPPAQGEGSADSH